MFRFGRSGINLVSVEWSRFPLIHSTAHPFCAHLFPLSVPLFARPVSLPANLIFSRCFSKTFGHFPFHPLRPYEVPSGKSLNDGMAPLYQGLRRWSKISEQNLVVMLFRRPLVCPLVRNQVFTIVNRPGMFGNEICRVSFVSI